MRRINADFQPIFSNQATRGSVLHGVCDSIQTEINTHLAIMVLLKVAWNLLFEGEQAEFLRLFSYPFIFIHGSIIGIKVAHYRRCRRTSGR